MQGTFANEAEQRVFRDELQQMLRHGQAEQALDRARARLRGVDVANPQLVERALTASVADITLTGWDELATRIASVENYGNEPVTAIEIDFSSPTHFHTSAELKALIENDPHGGFSPVLETNYHGDQRAVKFSSASREDILRGYSSYGNEWQGGFIDIDNLIGVEGMALLYGAVLGSRERDPGVGEADASLLAACINAILLHLAVKRTIETRGIPKPLAILVGSNEDFPFFNAPIMSVDESSDFVEIFAQQAASRRAREDAARAQAHAERAQQKAEQASFDPVMAMEHFGEAAKIGGEMLKLMRKEKDVFLGIGVVGLALVAQHFRSRK